MASSRPAADSALRMSGVLASHAVPVVRRSAPAAAARRGKTKAMPIALMTAQAKDIRNFARTAVTEPLA